MHVYFSAVSQLRSQRKSKGYLCSQRFSEAWGVVDMALSCCSVPQRTSQTMEEKGNLESNMIEQAVLLKQQSKN